MRFRPERNLAAKIEREPGFKRFRRATAQAAAAASRRLSPDHTGDYADSFVVAEDGSSFGNDDFAAHLVEYGSANNPPYAPLRRGARAAGLRLEEEGKQ